MGIYKIPRTINLVAWRTGFEPSKVWGFRKIPRTINLVAGEGFEPSKAEPVP
jgi:hypothetical protein